MIVIFAFVIAYLFATSVFSAGIVKLFRYNKKLKNSKRKDDQDKSIELQNKANKDENAKQYSQEEQQRKSVEQSETCCYNLDRHGFLSRNREFFYHLFVYFMPLWIVILYLHLLMLYILYMLMIGRGTVITTGPAFIISLFTPALLSSIAAAVLKKSTIIKDAKEEEK
jgi:Flp pilus assembly protein TadB